MDENSCKYPNWNEQFNKDDIKANTILTKKLIRSLPQSNKMRTHNILYLVLGIIFIVMIVLSCLPCPKIPSWLQELFMALGTGGISAIFIATIIENMDASFNVRAFIKEHNDSIENIYYQLWKIFSCKSFSYVNDMKTQKEKEIWVNKFSFMYLEQINNTIYLISIHKNRYLNLMTEGTNNKLAELEQLLQDMQSDLQNPIDFEHNLSLLDGIRGGLKKLLTVEWMKQQFRIIK